MRRSTPFLFFGMMLSAAGYGATFLLPAYFRLHGGGDLEAGATLGAAMLGTFVGVPVVGWVSGPVDPSRLAAVASGLLGCGFLLLATYSGLPMPAGFLVGLGWGMIYLGVPMALSERVGDAERAVWFTRLGAFQMAGIGGGPLLMDLAMDRAHLPVETIFRLIGAACFAGGAALWAFGMTAPSTRRGCALRPWVRPSKAIACGRSRYPTMMVVLGACVFSGLLTFQSSLVAGTAARPASFYAVYAVTVVAARLLFGRLLAALPQAALATGLLLAMASGVAAMAAVDFHPAFQLVAATLTGLGYGLVYTVIQTWAVNDAAPEHRHAALTWFVLSYFVGVFGWPVLGGWVLVHLGGSAFLAILLVATFAELGLVFARHTRERRDRDLCPH